MPPKSEVDIDHSVPRARSVACRRCGSPIAFDTPDDDGTVRCACGIVNLIEET